MIAILDVLTPMPPFIFDEVEPPPPPPDDDDHGGSEEGPGEGPGMTTGLGQDYRLLKKRREAMIAAIMAMEADD